MNLTLLRQITILSAVLGAVLGILTLIPFIGNIAFFTLMCLTSAIIIILMIRCEMLEMLSVKEGMTLGAIIGFISFIVFAIVYLPCVTVLGKVFKLYSLYGISLIMSVGSLGVIMMLTIFTAVLSAVINAFTAFLTFYGIDLYSNLKRNDIKKQDYNNDDEFKL